MIRWLLCTLVCGVLGFGHEELSGQEEMSGPGIERRAWGNLEPGIYRITSACNGRYVDAYEDRGNDYELVTRDFQDNGSQEWQVIGTGSYKYMKQTSSGRYMDAYESSSYKLVTRTYQDNYSQQFLLKVTGIANRFKLYQGSSGRYFDAYTSGGYNAVTRTEQHDCSQQWDFARVDLAITSLPPTKKKKLNNWVKKMIVAMEGASCDRHRYWQAQKFVGVGGMFGASCPAGKWRHRGLICYEDCKSGYKQEGMECVRNCNYGPHRTECTGYCTADSGKCAEVIATKTFAVFSMVMNFVPGGSTLRAAKTAYKAYKTGSKTALGAAKTVMKKYLRTQGKVLRKAAKKNLKTFVKAEIKKQIKSTINDSDFDEIIDESIDSLQLQQMQSQGMEADMVELAKAMDPTGLSDVIDAFAGRECKSMWPVLQLN